LTRRIAELKSRIRLGGIREAVLRSALYIGLGRNSVDERGIELVRRIRTAQRDLPGLSLADFKALVREQFLMLLIDEEAAIGAIPAMLPAEADLRVKGFETIKYVLSARGELSAEDTERCARIAELFRLDQSVRGSPRRIRRASVQDEAQAKAF
jgi:hypothetical protein